MQQYEMIDMCIVVWVGRRKNKYIGKKETNTNNLRGQIHRYTFYVFLRSMKYRIIKFIKLRSRCKKF